jgi:serine/threonine protein kinase
MERVIAQLSDALIELHERQGRPLVHGAIRPSNVLIAGDGVEVLGLCASSHSKDVFDEGR